MTTQLNIQTWMAKWLSNEGLTTQFSIKQLAGDGSTRTFYRISLPDKNFILLWDPDWTLSQDYPAHQKFLADHGIDVPEFYACDPKVGALLMEDLGDDLLQHEIQKHPQRKYASIEQSVKLLAKLHGSTFPVPETLPCAKRSFDKQKYLSELEFTVEHLSQKLFNEKVAPQSETHEVFAERLGAILPHCFSHRDFHTRNILQKGTNLVLIDFQDARLGPPHYDLASILYDAYMPLQESERTTLIATYKEELQKFKLYKLVNWDNFTADFKLVALQRTIKAAGSFASFYTRYGKTTHLPYLLPALEMAQSLDFNNYFPIKEWIRKSKELKVK